jgi:hypothetical protein
MFPMFVFLSLYMQQVLGYSAIRAGLAFLVIAVGIIASAIGVRSADAGLASGLINTSQQIGGAIGLAVTTTVAAARTATLLHAGHSPASALTGGFHAVFAITGAMAVAGALVAVTLMRRTTAPAEPSLPSDQTVSTGDIDVS